jgi:hypothetical protein
MSMALTHAFTMHWRLCICPQVADLLGLVGAAITLQDRTAQDREPSELDWILTESM